MPLVDRRTNSVVLRIVYDGPPEAGKTTNLKQLCERLSLGRRGTLESPGGQDRTQFFDWLDVTGGWVGGRRVQCQLVTVPGQIQLARRRRYILDSADVVVFVADSRAGAAPEATAALRSLARGLGNRPDVPLLLQANKQDLPGAQAPLDLHRALTLAAHVPVIGAHASGGAGVLETFMLAVRIAVDHVRALLVAGELAEGDATSAAELLLAFEADTPEPAPAIRASAHTTEPTLPLAAPRDTGGIDAPNSTSRPAVPLLPPPPPLRFSLPPVDLPAGLVWPAVSGRAALAALTSPVLVTRVTTPWAPTGAIELVCDDGWIAHTSPELGFSELELGRTTLLEAVRWQARMADFTLPGRTYALSPEANGARLWVLTPVSRTVWETVQEALHRDDRAGAGELARRGLEVVDEIRKRGIAIGDLGHLTTGDPPRLLTTPWTPARDRLTVQLQRLRSAAVL